MVPGAIYFLSIFHRVAPAVVAADLMRAFGITAAALGSLAAIYPYVFAAMALVAGSLADTLGPRRTLALGAVTMGIGAALFGAAPTFAAAYTARLLVGLGASVILISWLSLAARWFRANEFATVSGFTQTVGNAGALLGSSPLALTVEAIGWRHTFVAVGAMTLLLALVAWLAVRDRPEAIGLPAVSGSETMPMTLPQVLRAIPSVLSNLRTWPPVLVATGVYATSIAFVGLWGVPYLMQVYGLGRVQAANIVALIPLGLAIGGPLVGWISDRWLGRRRLPFVAFTVIYVACWLPLAIPMLAPGSPSGLVPVFFVMGLSSSGLVLVWSCVREVNDPRRVGVAIGFCNMPIFFGFAVLQWVMGVILDARWAGETIAGARLYPPAAFEAAFALCLGAALVAVLIAALVTETRCRNVWRG